MRYLKTYEQREMTEGAIIQDMGDYIAVNLDDLFIDIVNTDVHSWGQYRGYKKAQIGLDKYTKKVKELTIGKVIEYDYLHGDDTEDEYGGATIGRVKGVVIVSDDGTPVQTNFIIEEYEGYVITDTTKPIKIFKDGSKALKDYNIKRTTKRFDL